MDEFTVGDLRRALKFLPDEAPLSFDGGVTFNKVRSYDNGSAFIEFNEVQAHLSPKFRKQHPEVLVTFCQYENTGEIIQQVSIPEF